ncbi:ornithine racemase Orr [Alkaliphilus metalliredigens]|nr:ornithine racemase Orr [Alkaliphilus metalliredigens]
MNPKVTIDLAKLRHNARVMTEKCNEYGIAIAGVTKVFGGRPEIAQAMIDGGIQYLADSRVENLKKMKDLSLPKILLRLPMISRVDDVVKYCDISLNSEVETIIALSQAAEKQHKTHKIILMVDLGDLREGIFDSQALKLALDEIKNLKGIKVVGIGTNLTCYGGVIPDEENLGRLIAYASEIEAVLGTKLEIISGGNSSSIYMVQEGRMLEEVNLLRLGEAIVLGTESAYGNVIPGTHQDIFQLEAEIIEIKEKPSIPIGKIGMDAFGNKPSFEDKGVRKRAILAVGKQDIGTHAIRPVNVNVIILGGSSDHLIVDITDCDMQHQIGSTLTFDLTYGALLSLMTSEYIYKQMNDTKPRP